MDFIVDCILIPENYIRIRMKTSEFDKYLKEVLDGSGVIYILNNIRYVFTSDDMVIEELK